MIIIMNGKNVFKILIGFSQGSASDILANIISPEISKIFGQEVIIQSYLGGNGINAMQALNFTDSIENTILMATLGSHVFGRVFSKERVFITPYFGKPIAKIASCPLVILASTKLKIQSIHELILYASNKNKSIQFGSSAIGGTPHLAGLIFCKKAGINMIHRDYVHTNELYKDLVDGNLDITFNNIMSALPLIKTRKVVPIAITSLIRHPLIPTIPTVVECGINDYAIENWLGFCVNNNVSEIRKKLLKKMIEVVLSSASVQNQLKLNGMSPFLQFDSSFEQTINLEMNYWSNFLHAFG